MVQKFHVHVYKVVGKAEVDTLAENGVKAKEMALEAVKQGILKFTTAEETLIAMDFKEKQ